MRLISLMSKMSPRRLRVLPRPGCPPLVVFVSRVSSMSCLGNLVAYKTLKLSHDWCGRKLMPLNTRQAGATHFWSTCPPCVQKLPSQQLLCQCPKCSSCLHDSISRHFFKNGFHARPHDNSSTFPLPFPFSFFLFPFLCFPFLSLVYFSSPLDTFRHLQSGSGTARDMT